MVVMIMTVTMMLMTMSIIYNFCFLKVFYDQRWQVTEYRGDNEKDAYCWRAGESNRGRREGVGKEMDMVWRVVVVGKKGIEADESKAELRF